MPIHKLKLIKQDTVANQTILLTFEKPENFQFQAGQYGGFTLIDPEFTDDHGITRRFSLISAPDDPHLCIATRIQKSAFKRNLQNLQPGQEIKFAGPIGNFILHEDSQTPAVLIAGGIGLAPFYSMIRHTLKHQPERRLFLFYGNQTLADSALIQELQDLANAHPQFTFVPTFANPHPEWQGETGFISDDMLVKYVKDLDQPIYYVCGSPAMVAVMQQLLKDMLISDEKVKVEDFPGY